MVQSERKLLMVLMESEKKPNALRAFFTWEESTEQDDCNLSFKPNCTNVKAGKMVNPHSFIPRHYERGVER